MLTSVGDWVAQVAEQAHHNVMLAANSSALLFPAPDPSDPPPPMVAGADGRATPNPPLYNYKALQLWILRQECSICSAGPEWSSAIRLETQFLWCA